MVCCSWVVCVNSPEFQIFERKKHPFFWVAPISPQSLFACERIIDMVDQEVFPTSIPPLWSEEEVKVSEEGFLILKKNMALLTPSLQEQQPLLLHSAERFLKELYPSRRISDILSIEPEPLSLQEQEATSEQGHCDDNDAIDEPSNDGETMDIDCMDIDSVQSTSEEIESEPVPAQETKQMESSEINKPQGRNKTKIKRTESETQAASAVDTTTHQQVYHKLKRCNNMGNRILQLIMDIQSFRHRPIKRDKDADRLSRDQAKVRALEKQQKHILRGKITSSPGMDTATTEDDGTTKGRKEKCVGDKDRKNGNDDDTDADGDADNNNNNDDDDDQLTPSEPNIVRLVRTINSVRAVFPHLLQILNHKRRNDRSLKIRSVEWSSKRRGFCWILGSQVFDTTSSKVLIHAHKDCTFILDSYISAELAQRICNDPMGGSKDFWSKSWIPELQTRSNPTIQDPLAILTAYADAPIRDSIVKKTLECDERLQLDSTISNVQEIHSKYEVAVKKLHQTISKLLKDRFPDARVSIYGSCLSNLSLGKGADVDLSLWLPKAEQLQTDFHEGRIGASKYEKEMKSFVFQVFHKLNSRGKEFRDMHPVTRARVPVVTGTYNFAQNPYSLDGSIQ